MARGDIKIRSTMDAAFTLTRLVASGTSLSIPAGTPSKENGSNVGVVAPMVDGDGTTSQRFSGIAKSDSSETTTAAGVVRTWYPLPGIIYEAFAKVPSLANTAALIDALKAKRVVFDLTSGVWTVDTGASDASTNGIVIVGGSFQNSSILFVTAPQITSFFV